MSADYVIQARRGDASPHAVGLVAGQVVGPLAFGQTASWPVAARGVLPQHGFLYFDGAMLFVRSVDAMLPVRIGDHAVPEDWIPVQAPSRILFGGAELSFERVPRAEGQLGDLSAPPEPSVDETGRYPLPKRTDRAAPGAAGGERRSAASTSSTSSPAPTSARIPVDTSASNAGPRTSAAPRAAVPDLSPKRGRGPIDDEVTRLGSMDEIVLRARAAKAAVEASSPSLQRPSEGAAAGRGAPLFGPPPARTVAAASTKPLDPIPSPLAAGSPPAGSPSTGSPSTASATAGSRSASVRPTPSPPAGLAARWSAASLPNKASIVLMPLMAASLWIIFFYEDAGARPRPKPSASASAASAASASSAAPNRSDATRPSETSSGPTDVAPAPSGSGPRPKTARAKERTLERRAADAVAAGDYAGAAKLYEELAREQPDRVAFKEAARILRAKSTTRK